MDESLMTVTSEVTIDSDATTSPTSESPKKKRGRNKIYEVISTFDSRQEVEETILDWVYNKRTDTAEGERRYYRCAASRKCPKKLCVLYAISDNKFHVSISDDEHGHVVKHSS